jgi:hypothetical protein
MRPITATVLFALGTALAFAAARSTADEPKGEVKPENKLLGTWKLVSAKYGGKEVPSPEGTTRLKHVTSSQFMWLVHDKDGKAQAGWGGTYTLKAEAYIEIPEYGVEGVPDEYKGKPQEFKWKIEDKKWYHTGKLSTGLTIEEVWERVEKK